MENKQIFTAEARQATDIALLKKQSATEMYVMVFIAFRYTVAYCSVKENYAHHKMYYSDILYSK